MKKFSVFPLIAALTFFVSCQKQQTEEERKAEVERQVQDRLAAERVEAEKQRLAQDQAALAAREKALADWEAAAAAVTTTPAEEPAATAPPTVVTERSEPRTEKRSTAAYGMFYEKLDPYGEWRETSNYGYVWQPREAEQSRDWRPYTEGRWVYSDAGWTWVSDESFGWATYHYGRWLRLKRVGWVWVPGDEWAPAWVSWRSNKDYVGWAPLPPEARFDRRSGIQNWADSYYDIGPDQYAFVSSNEFGNEHVRRSVVPAERNSSIVIETTNVTRITFANTSIVNEGPNYDELRSRSRRPIERYRLRRDRNTEAAAIVRGDELEISVPLITEVRDMPRPRRLKERVVEIDIDNGWTVADRSAAERARTKIRTEATPPPNAPPKVFVKPTETSTTTASATPVATAATTPPPSAAASPTPSAATSPTPAATAKTSPTPMTTIPSPTPTAAAPASATPSASPRTRPRPTPSATPAAAGASPTPATTPGTAATATPAASATVRVRPSPTIPKPSPSIAPAATAPAATSTPAAATTPAVRVRPSPTVSLGATPTPIAKPSLPPAATPPIQQRTPPPLSTPVPTAPPLSATEKELKPSPTLPPVKRPSVPPRTVLPTPSLPPTETIDAARPPVPQNGPKRTMPPRLTPPPAVAPAATSTAAPSSPPVTDERAKNRKPKRPGETETGTPTPAPSTPPN
jgi:Family of unknown function (DUF6600)